MAAKYIFVTGGVMSGIGKGVATSSIGALLQARGFNVTAVKIDQYLNVDAGTMNPVEHGEVFVTEDGMETDQDIGNYERFLDKNISGDNYMTSGSVYLSVIQGERNLNYEGRCVEVVPDIPNEVLRRLRIVERKTKADFVLVEIGGTVGEYQNLLFLEAARMLHLQHPEDVLFVLVSYLPVPGMIGEMKTKPTQYAVRSLNSAGIQPDIIVARSEQIIDEPRKRKLSIFCNVEPADIIAAPDIHGSIYEVPLNFEKDGIAKRILHKFDLRERPLDLKDWAALVNTIRKENKKEVRIGVVGKYFETGNFILADSYISVLEAIKHAAWAHNRNPVIQWLNADDFETDKKKLEVLKKYDGIVVPGGFGKRGVEGKIKAIGYCRRNKIPFFGLCYGMQLATIEFARNVLGFKDAHTTEVDPKTSHPVIDIMAEQSRNLQEKKMGGTMRLGSYACELLPGTQAQRTYAAADFPAEKQKNGGLLIQERHRHRYELNNEYRKQLEGAGMVISGVNPQRDLAEIIELPGHPFFVGTQFHPEFQSRPLRPHPLFLAFIKAAIGKK